MKNLKNMLNLNKNVICLDYDNEYEVMTFVHKASNVFYEVQVYNSLYYMATLTDDETGEELGVQLLTASDFARI